jgi:hypothetical protein
MVEVEHQQTLAVTVQTVEMVLTETILEITQTRAVAVAEQQTVVIHRVVRLVLETVEME